MSSVFRFYANENLSALLVKALRDRGHDVLTSYESDRANQRIPDDGVLRDATIDGRCVVTFNRDDFVALHRGGMEHAGIVICKDDRDCEGQAQMLEGWLRSPTCLNNRCLRVLRRNERGNSQPVWVIQEYGRSG
jgi:Domain of unknown function (DUF5615)